MNGRFFSSKFLRHVYAYRGYVAVKSERDRGWEIWDAKQERSLVVSLRTLTAAKAVIDSGLSLKDAKL